jgi:hypothetical protein
MSKTYNGWPNYETWNVALWLDNDEYSHNYWTSQAEVAVKDHDGNKDEATQQLAGQIKDELEESRPDLGASMWADLLGAARL